MAYESRNGKDERQERSQELPGDPFDQQLERLTGLPGGASTKPVVVQTSDFYGVSTQWISQVVKTEDGDNVFLTRVNASGRDRIVVPARVLATIDRQRATVTKILQRRHGRRIAEERKARASAKTEA